MICSNNYIYINAVHFSLLDRNRVCCVVFTTLQWACAKRKPSWPMCCCDHERRQRARDARGRMARCPPQTNACCDTPAASHPSSSVVIRVALA